MSCSPKPPNVVDVRATLRTLAALARDPRALADLDPRQRLAIVEAARAIAGVRPRAPRPLPAPLSTSDEAELLAAIEESEHKRRPTRACYVCGALTIVDEDALCATCRATEHVSAHALEVAREDQVLAGKIVVVTGGRVNIGFATALSALRLGARVIATTRFADDARARFFACDDAAAWRDRLSVCALDLRDLPGVERLAAQWSSELDGIDALVHNAAQTLPLSARAMAALSTVALPASEALVHALLPPAAAHVSTEPTVPRSTEATSIAEAERGPYGEVPDASWRAHVPDVSTRELLEVLLINAAAPFVLTRALLPLLKRCPRSPRVVVNVTSSEGRFSFSRPDEHASQSEEVRDSDERGERRGKSSRHPHLNMAKAALNMMTRTSASELAKDDIVLVGVDPGWVSGPLPTGGFANGRFPLDADEAARRVLHPVVAAARGQPPRAGVLYKNYRPAPW